MYTFDHDLFLRLNFDGGPAMDAVMSAFSGLAVWTPLYVLTLWLIHRRYGWRGILVFLIAVAIVVGLSDMISSLFKGRGLLKAWLPDDFVPRPRPMYTPILEGLNITPDSLRVLRRAAVPMDWQVHVLHTGGLYGTVSSHAANHVALAVLSAGVVQRRWFTVLMVLYAAAVCYSRIYLAMHFPMDLFWGTLIGIVLGSLGVWELHRSLRVRNRV